MANQVVKKHIIDGIYSYTINYVAGSDCGPISGMQLTGGRPVNHQGEKFVRFETQLKGQTIQVRCANRPELAALVAEYEDIQEQIEAERKARRAAKQAEQDAIDKPLLEAMEKRVAELRTQIPEGHIEVKATKIGDYGALMYDYEAEGVKLKWQDVNRIGVAYAIRPGAMGAFSENHVCSINRERLEEIKVVQVEAQRKADEEKAKAKKEAEERKDRQTRMQVEVLFSNKAKRQEEGEDIETVVKITDTQTGESLEFVCRNVFDVGYIVNPNYAVAPGMKKGGLAAGGKWQTYKSGEGWVDVREMTDLEKRCVCYLGEFPPIYSNIRM